MNWTEVADRLWRLIESHIPIVERSAAGGRPRIPDEVVFAKLVAFLRAGCAWDVFDELCRGGEVSGRTCRRRFAEWRDLGIFELVCNELRSELPEPAIAHLDATFIRSRGGGEDLVGLTRHGKGSKIQALTDEDSMPLMFQLTSANPNESTITHSLLEDVDELPAIVVADKAYDYDFLRDAFAERGSKLLSPHRVTRSKPPRDQEQIGRHYKRRWAVERLFAWLAAWRRLANRWERRAEHYWQWLCLGISLIYTRRKYWP
ncbi:MAG: IS5 family transposase [Thermoleophilia bacterium]|nr:IS5 family transposase [Thermoleophilia bacterium]